MIYFTCIELHDAGLADYAALDDAMAVAGFSKTAQSDEHATHRLPTGLYRIQSQRPTSAILDVARDIANATGFANEVLTIPTRGARWYPRKERAGQAAQ